MKNGFKYDFIIYIFFDFSPQSPQQCCVLFSQTTTGQSTLRGKSLVLKCPFRRQLKISQGIFFSPRRKCKNISSGKTSLGVNAFLHRSLHVSMLVVLDQSLLKVLFLAGSIFCCCC